MAWIDPLSGLMAPVGNNQLKSWQFFAEKFNASNPAGVKFEVIGIDNKLSPTESLNALKAAIDQGIRYIIQGNGSSVALALIDAINKHNERNPGKEVIFLNEAAVDPDLTNSKCSFWHFRFDADTTMKMEAMTTFMKDQKDIKKVYLFNQNYSHGQQVAKYAKEYLKRKRPDIEIVGEDLHPLAQVRDFAPYIAKIKASGADSVITGNWGSDLSLLVKAAERGRLQRQVLHLLHRRHRHADGARHHRRRQGLPGRLQPLQHGRADTRPGRRSSRPSTTTTSTPARSSASSRLLGQAMAQAKSTDPVKVAQAHGGPEVQERVRRRRRDAQERPPAAAAAVHDGLAEGRRASTRTAPRTPA